jgi:hypothetical protein
VRQQCIASLEKARASLRMQQKNNDVHTEESCQRIALRWDALRGQFRFFAQKLANIIYFAVMIHFFGKRLVAHHREQVKCTLRCLDNSEHHPLCL